MIATRAMFVAGLIATAAGVASAAGDDAAIAARARDWFGRLQRRDIDRAQLTPAMKAGLSATTVATVAAQIAPLGAPVTFPFVRTTGTAGVTGYVYRPTFASGVALDYTFAVDRAGKIDGLFVTAVPAATPPAPASAPSASPQLELRAREWFGRLQRRDIDAAQLTDAARTALTPDALAAGAKLIAPLGDPVTFPLVRSSAAGGVVAYVYRPTFASGEALEYTFGLDGSGTVAELFIAPTAAASSTPEIDTRAKDWLRRLRADDLDRSQLTADLNAALTPEVLAPVRKDLNERGDPASVTFARAAKLAGVTAYVYDVTYAAKPALQYTFSLDDAGKIAGLFFKAR